MVTQIEGSGTKEPHSIEKLGAGAVLAASTANRIEKRRPGDENANIEPESSERPRAFLEAFSEIFGY